MTNQDLGKHVVLVEYIKRSWIRKPFAAWPRQRFIVCEINDNPELPEILTDFLSIEKALLEIDGAGWTLIENETARSRIGANENDRDLDFEVAITAAVMAQLGVMVVKVELHGKSGRLPLHKQLLSPFWVISISTGKLLSIHPSERNAYAAVSNKYQAEQKASLAAKPLPRPG